MYKSSRDVLQMPLRPRVKLKKKKGKKVDEKRVLSVYCFSTKFKRGTEKTYQVSVRYESQ